MFIVVSYDIADDKRRVRVATELESLGQRVQYKVFECHPNETEIQELKHRMQVLINWDRDRVRYYTLCARDERRIIVDGPGDLSQDWSYRIV